MLRRFVISCVLLALPMGAAARTRPHYGGTLRVETEADPWQKPDGLALRLVFDGLTRFDSSGAVQPALAVAWTSDNDDHRWEFRLRPGVHFHDGTPLTSIAVGASLNVACPANCPWTSVRAVGSSVVFTSDSPMPDLPALLATDEFLIALTVTGDSKTAAPNVGTGPFQVSGTNNGVLTLTANESCWGGRPFADQVQIAAHRPIRDQWLDLGVGHADIVEVPAEQIRQAQQQRLTVVQAPQAALLALEVADTGALGNPVLRAAIAQAVDRGALYSVIFQKQGAIASSLLPQSLSGFAFLFPGDPDLNKANALRGGLSVPPLSLGAEGDGALHLVAQRIALNLHEAGFNAQVVSAGGGQHPDLLLRMLPLEGAEPRAALNVLLREVGQPAVPAGADPAALYRMERGILDRHTLIPLLDLPRAYAAGGRVRDLHLRADGVPDLAGASLEDAR